MPETLQSRSNTSFVKEIRKIDPAINSTITIPVLAQVKTISGKKEETLTFSDLPFDEWNLPPQQEGYIKCSKHDFL